MVNLTFNGMYLLMSQFFDEYDSKNVDKELNSNSMYKLVVKLLKLLRKDDSIAYTIEEISGKLRVSVQYLQRAVRSVMNLSLGELVDYYRLSYTHRQLMFTNKDIDEIAEETGFASTSSFIRYFKHYMQTTPNKYRMLKSYSVY
ncbi:MAG: helix-turn-helix transcriptional regulator [Muribaculaceae bacterium]